MRTLFIILAFLLTACTKAQTGILGPVVGGGSTPGGAYVAAVNSTIIDDGSAAPALNGQPTEYNGFPWPVALSDGSIVTFWKKSDTHAGKGFHYMARSTDGGATWTSRQVTVGGQGIYCVALSNPPQAIDGRIVISYQDNPAAANYWEDYDNISIAWIDEADLIADFAGADFTFSTTKTFTYSGGLSNRHYVTSPFGKPMKVGNELWLPFYKFLSDYTDYLVSPSNPPVTEQTEATYLVSTDNGVTWTEAATPILTRSGGEFPNGFTSEHTFVITHNTGVKATTKIVCYIRNEQYGYYTHVRTADGGGAWTADNTNLFYAPGSTGTKKPVHPIMYNGTVYIFWGNRLLLADNSTQDFKLQYVTATPDDVFNNNQSGYSAVVDVLTANAESNGAGEHWGYTEPFIRKYADAGIDELLVHYYDTSPQNNNTTYIRCMIAQRVIVSNNQ